MPGEEKLETDPHQMKVNKSCVSLSTFLLFFVLNATRKTASAQDNVRGSKEPIVHTFNPDTLTYDYLVDGNLSKNDPAHHRFKTLQAAYEAAPAGTEERPTVIGIRPDVYFLKGGEMTPGLSITKNYITLLGLTNNRRSVVLADNRGLQQGAGNDGFVMDVNATGFTVKNLTIINYCNVDYEYPGDPGKDLKKRSDVITQAVALQARGDKQVYENVALLSRLDTFFLLAKRSYFKNVYIEGTDDWIGGGGVGLWENCTLLFPTGQGVMSSTNNVFRDCRFIASKHMEFYKVGFKSELRPCTLINCVVPVSTPNSRVAWMREKAPARPHLYSMTWHVKDANGNPAKIYDSNIGRPAFRYSRELTAKELKAFNPWNLLRAVPGSEPDNWDPAGVKGIYENAGEGALVYRVRLTNGSPENHKPAPDGGTFHIRTGETKATIGAAVTPVYARDPTVTWSTPSNLISLNRTTGPTVVVVGRNGTEHAEWVPVRATAANGLFATAWVYVEPSYVDPPAIVSGPVLSQPVNGKINLEYKLDLKKGREDQSIATWSVCNDASGSNERVVAVSRGDKPLRSLTLTPGYVGKYIKVSLAPRNQRSKPGTDVSVISKAPVVASEVDLTRVSPDFRNFVITPNQSVADGMWTVSRNWRIESGEGLENGYGIHSTGPASLFYQRDADTGDMQLDLLFRPDKTEGQVFSVPGSPADSGANNLHADIYIKYNPRTGNGYSLRFWRTTRSAKKCMFQFYKIKNGVGTPLDSHKELSGVFKRDTHLILKVAGNTITATASNTKDHDTLHLQSRIVANHYGGAGMLWSRGTSAICSRFAITWKKR